MMMLAVGPSLLTSLGNFLFLYGSDLLYDDVGGGSLPPHQPRQLLGNGWPGLRRGLTQGGLGDVHQLVSVVTDLGRHQLYTGLLRLLLLLRSSFVSLLHFLLFSVKIFPHIDVGKIKIG